jgi:hypothetical protein
VDARRQADDCKEPEGERGESTAGEMSRVKILAGCCGDAMQTRDCRTGDGWLQDCIEAMLISTLGSQRNLGAGGTLCVLRGGAWCVAKAPILR